MLAFRSRLDCLRSRRRLLEVVHVQVLLEVEVRQLVLLGQAQQLQELRIRVNIVLVLQVVVAHVLGDELRDVRAALQAARGAAHERAQLGRQASGHLEDAHARRLARLALHHLAAAALVGQLLHLRSLLL